MKITHTRPHRPARRKDYMPVGDQLDAIMKGFRAIEASGVALPLETMVWLEHCEAVKAKHPKPT